MKADAVFEGGGVRGVAFAGAIEAMEKNNVEWMRIAGTSAGSVVAALLAAGYTSQEIRHTLEQMDFSRFRGRTFVNRIPLIGNLVQLIFSLGMYKNDYLSSLVDRLLAEKGIETFADLPEGKLKIIASDISYGKMLIFPDDLPRYGMQPADVKISKAVMMSTSMPFFYRPVIWKGKNGKKSYILDGGLLSNFPIWIFDEKNPRHPTIGFHFMKEKIIGHSIIPSPLHLFENIFRTMLQAHDLRHLDKNSIERTVQIPTGDITATDFDLSKPEIDFLYSSGYHAATEFLASWDFNKHKMNRIQQREPAN
ncbi:patatin-like phospholipase family protein [Virgibacillus sp. YIM 98842]|uniref:patatin-like phospholipase family protein n=1 Tax=Virgibacillus sp. YIM 98842 TaxID=2663533 RepID=UPI0013DB0E1F|nr:patatin-like phospholipase family protein [Virgibacillus sp. YIM 98842]